MASDRCPVVHTSFWIPAQELVITSGDDAEYWKWISLTDPHGSEEVAELLQVERLEIKGTMELKKLSIKTSYSAYLVFKLKKASVGLNKAKGRVRYISKGKDPEDKEERSVLIDGEKIPGDGEVWMEIKLGEFFNDLGDDGRSVEAALLEIHKDWKSGLIVKGIEVRPNLSSVDEEVVSSYLRSKFSSILSEEEANSGILSQFILHFRSIEEQINSTCSEKSISSSYIPVDVLYGLIDALLECCIFAHRRHKAAASKKVFFQVYYFKKNMNRRLDEIRGKVNMIKTRPDQDIQRSPLGLVIPQTHPVRHASEIIGFESEAAKIEALLLMAASTKEEEEEEAEEFTAIGIVGRCGCGKTALAQKVFASPTIQKEFSPRIWVCLSTMLFDNECLDPRLRVLIHILEQIDHNVSELEYADFSVVELLEKVQCGLMGKRYLIVLDDAFRVDEWFADLGYGLPRGYPMGGFFSHGLPKGSGGAIIVTSQSENAVKRMVGDKHVIRLEHRMSDEMCWRIFCHLVRQQGTVNLDDHPKLDKIKEHVIRKCDGLPLGAKVMADVIPNLLGFVIVA